MLLPIVALFLCHSSFSMKTKLQQLDAKIQKLQQEVDRLKIVKDQKDKAISLKTREIVTLQRKKPGEVGIISRLTDEKKAMSKERDSIAFKIIDLEREIRRLKREVSDLKAKEKKDREKKVKKEKKAPLLKEQIKLDVAAMLKWANETLGKLNRNVRIKIKNRVKLIESLNNDISMLESAIWRYMRTEFPRLSTNQTIVKYGELLNEKLLNINAYKQELGSYRTIAQDLEARRIGLKRDIEMFITRLTRFQSKIEKDFDATQDVRIYRQLQREYQELQRRWNRLDEDLRSFTVQIKEFEVRYKKFADAVGFDVDEIKQEIQKIKREPIKKRKITMEYPDITVNDLTLAVRAVLRKGIQQQDVFAIRRRIARLIREVQTRVNSLFKTVDLSINENLRRYKALLGTKKLKKEAQKKITELEKMRKAWHRLQKIKIQRTLQDRLDYVVKQLNTIYTEIFDVLIKKIGLEGKLREKGEDEQLLKAFNMEQERLQKLVDNFEKYTAQIQTIISRLENMKTRNSQLFKRFAELKRLAEQQKKK